MPATILVVGYKTAAMPVTYLKEVQPRFTPKANLVDKAKIAADIAEKTQLYVEDAASNPYTGYLEKVAIADITNAGKIKLSGEKTPGATAVDVVKWLTETYPGAWPSGLEDTMDPWKKNPIVFIGFSPKRFLKFLGIECTTPARNPSKIVKIPTGLWYSNSSHRDLIEAICPSSEFKKLEFETALKSRRPLDPKSQEKWDELTKQWKEPWIDPSLDLALAIELTAQLGFI